MNSSYSKVLMDFPLALWLYLGFFVGIHTSETGLIPSEFMFSGDVIPFEDFQPALFDAPQFREFLVAATPLLVTEQMKSLFKKIPKIANESARSTLPVILTGPSGSGKTSTLLYLVHQAQRYGIIVLSVNGKDFMDSSYYDAQWDCLDSFQRWNSPVLLSKVHLPDRNISLMDFVDSVTSSNYKNDSALVEVIDYLLKSSNLPVIIILDQMNLLLGGAVPQLGNTTVLRRIWNRNHMRNRYAQVIYAVSSSYNIAPQFLANGGQYVHFVRAMGWDAFHYFVDHLISAGQLPMVCNTNFHAFYDHCGGLPREATSWGQVWLLFGKPGFDVVTAEHLEKRTTLYKHRIRRVFSSEMDMRIKLDGYCYAVNHFLKRKGDSVPSYWVEAGLVTTNRTGNRPACKAIENALSEYTSDTFLDEAFSFLGSLLVREKIGWINRAFLHWLPFVPRRMRLGRLVDIVTALFRAKKAK